MILLLMIITVLLMMNKQAEPQERDMAGIIRPATDFPASNVCLQQQGGLSLATVKTYTIRITVESVKGKCALGNKPGTVFLVKETSPAGICLGALSALLPAIETMQYGGSFPWEADPDVAYIGCPDHINQVVYRLERVRNQQGSP